MNMTAAPAGLPERPESPPLGAAPARIAPRPRWDATELLERAAERSLRPVPDQTRSLGDRGRPASQETRRELHAPLCEILNRRYPDQMHEALCEGRSRQTHRRRQLVEAPVVRRPI